MFSEVVDAVIARSGRIDMKPDIAAFARATMRELQVHRGMHFTRDLVEDIITPVDPNKSSFVWDRPKLLRRFRTVSYGIGDLSGIGVISNAEIRWPVFCPPAKKQRDLEEYYYGGPNYFVFNGVFGAQINVAYYLYTPLLNYYEINLRPAVFDYETQTWSYLLNGEYVDTLGSVELDEAAQAKVWHWLLQDWRDAVEEGVLAKIFKIKGDERAVSSFALFKSYQNDLISGEAFESLGL